MISMKSQAPRLHPFLIAKTPLLLTKPAVSLCVYIRRNKLLNHEAIDVHSSADFEKLNAISLVINPEHGVIICKAHLTIVNADKLQAHFHHVKGHMASELLLYKDHIRRVINRCAIQQGQPEAPRFPVSPLSHLATPVPGFHCTHCSYAVMNPKGAREHERTGHVTHSGLVQLVQHNTYWKVEGIQEPHHPGLDKSSESQINKMTEELFRPKLRAIAESYVNV
jgi:hypothetical protein